MGGKMRANVTVFIYILFTHSASDRCGASFCSIFIVKISFAPYLRPLSHFSSCGITIIVLMIDFVCDFMSINISKRFLFLFPSSFSLLVLPLHKRKLHTQIIPPFQFSVGYLRFFGALSELSAAYPFQMSPRYARKKKSAAEGEESGGNNAIQQNLTVQPKR